MSEFSNTYEDQTRADSYARLEYPGTYYLAYRDLPKLINEHVHGEAALDFGCGTGRSTRFLRKLGFHVIGVDISQQMLSRAREIDPAGDYRLISDRNMQISDRFDLILCAFPFDNIPSMEKKIALFQSLNDALKSNGCIINLVSSPEVYVNEWTSFSTKDFPENRNARSGDKVRVIMLDVDDRRPVEDVFWTDEAYREVYTRAGLELIKTHRPLGKESEAFQWISETTISPWVIYLLKHAS